jgi:putative ubiquitin-RnfH superfamily antitoxin RatB of RatAB toxin-antitoxin module
MATQNNFIVEVAYALADKQKIISVSVQEGCTVLQAAQLSGIAQQFPDIDLNTAKMGIFSKAVNDPATQVVQAGERIEIYRPLLIDPKEARAQRAAKAKANKANKN